MLSKTELNQLNADNFTREQLNVVYNEWGYYAIVKAGKILGWEYRDLPPLAKCVRRDKEELQCVTSA